MVWRQVQALRHVERAWFLPSVEVITAMPHSGNKTHFWKAVHAVFGLKNYGKTPGTMTNLTIKVAAIADESEIGILDKIQGEIIKNVTGRPQAPGELSKIDFADICNETFTESDWDSINDGTKILVFFAQLRYKDNLQKEPRYGLLLSLPTENGSVV